tara:strand:+ start:388 stop:651 length:264 start_codon:yes stop_codon:yes gene_type:complete
MKKRSGSLKDLLNNVKYYASLMEIEPVLESIKIRHYISNWQFYKRKAENAKTKTMMLRHQQKMTEYWDLYCSLFPNEDSMMSRNQNI